MRQTIIPSFYSQQIHLLPATGLQNLSFRFILYSSLFHTIRQIIVFSRTVVFCHLVCCKRRCLLLWIYIIHFIHSKEPFCISFSTQIKNILISNVVLRKSGNWCLFTSWMNFDLNFHYILPTEFCVTNGI